MIIFLILGDFDFSTGNNGGSGFDSGLNEKIAVISGCVGGLLLVVVLLASYCYCFPSTLKNKINARRRNQNDGIDTEEKAENSDNVVNGGSIVVKSASRGSVLVNSAQDAACAIQKETSANGTSENNNKNATPEKRRLESTDYNGSQSLALAQGTHGNEVSSGIEARQNEDNEMELSGRKSLSMSIPDVTKVDPRRDSYVENPPPPDALPTVPQPQFFTLGRRAPRNNPRNSYFDPRSFEIANERLDMQQQRHSFHPGLHHQQFVLPPRQDMDLQGAIPAGGSYYNIFRPQLTSATLPPPQKTQRRQESDSSLYQEGSVDGDSITDGILCDDRTASPPPPAPSGPEPTHPMAYSTLKRRSLALL